MVGAEPPPPLVAANEQPIVFGADSACHLVFSFGYATSPGETPKQQNWKVWVSSEGVELANIVAEVVFMVQDALRSNAHTVRSAPYQLARTSTVQGNHNQEIEVGVTVHFHEWLRQRPITHELHVVLRAGRNRQQGLAQGPFTDDKMVVLRDPEAPIEWALHEAPPGAPGLTDSTHKGPRVGGWVGGWVGRVLATGRAGARGAPPSGALPRGRRLHLPQPLQRRGAASAQRLVERGRRCRCRWRSCA